LYSNLNRNQGFHMQFACEHAHKASQDKELASKDLFAGFALKVKSKENPMREVEIMQHIAREIKNHAHYFSILVGFGLSSTDLYVLTRELDGPSVFRIKEARPSREAKLFSEDTSKKIIKRLLQAVLLLHARGIAHWDIKAENTAFRIKPELLVDPEARGLLFEKLRFNYGALTDADLSMLDAMLIDFGQAVWFQPPVVTNASEEEEMDVIPENTANPAHIAPPIPPGSAAPSGSLLPPSPTVMQQSLASPSSVSAIGNVSPVPPGLTTFPWLCEMATGRTPPGLSHSMAPEHSDFLRDRPNTIVFRPDKIDMWQIGVMLFGFLTERALFTEATREKYFTNVRSDPLWQRKELERCATSVGVTLTEECKDFLLKLLHVKPSDRLTAEAALEDPWLK